MSTGDVRQPSGKLSAKAVAADGPKDDAAKAGSRQKGTGGGGDKTDTSPAGNAGNGKTGKGKTGKGKTATGSGGKNATGSGGKAEAKTGQTKSAPAKTAGGKGGPGKSGPGKGGAGRGPAKAAGGKGRRPVTPVKVSQGRNWGPIVMFGGAGVAAILIVGIALWPILNKPAPWQDRAKAIPGISLFLETNPDWFVPPADGNHKPGSLTYPSAPPVGGTHNGRWQNCMGNVYSAEIAKEHAVHSLEHGAVWITYRPDLPEDQIKKLADRVEGRSFLMMSPYPGQDKAISLQAWGYQLKVDNADDGRIDDFISALRENATVEPGAGCSGGITETATVPFDFGDGMTDQ